MEQFVCQINNSIFVLQTKTSTMKIYEDLKLRFEKPLWLLSPELAVADVLIENNPEYINIVSKDVLEGLKNNNQGRKDNLTVEQVLRAAIYKEMKRLTYSELEFAQFDSEICKAFLKLSNRKPFSDSVLQTYITKIKPENLSLIMKGIVNAAIELGYEDCSQIRTDSTAIETNIQHPTNNSLVYDCIKKATFFLSNMTEKHSESFRLLEERRQKAKKMNYEINNIKTNKFDKEAIRLKKTQEMKSLFEEYLTILKDIKDELKSFIENNLKELEDKEQDRIKDLERQIGIVYTNAYQFQIEGKKIKNENKIFSIFEEHTDILVKGIRDIVFGHKVNLTSGKSNLILYCKIEKGNPKDTDLFIEPITEIKESYQKPINSISTDGGYASLANVKKGLKEGLKNIVFTKIVGSLKSVVENEEIEKMLKKWRSGMEAVISNLKRGFDLRRVDWKGEVLFNAKVLWSVVAYNIRILTGHLLKTYHHEQLG